MGEAQILLRRLKVSSTATCTAAVAIRSIIAATNEPVGLGESASERRRGWLLYMLWGSEPNCTSALWTHPFPSCLFLWSLFGGFYLLQREDRLDRLFVGIGLVIFTAAVLLVWLRRIRWFLSWFGLA